MKKGKLFLGMTLALTCALSVCAVAACATDTDPVDPPGVKTTVFEAEGCDLSLLTGHGWSNNESGCGMIQGQNVAAIREKNDVLNSISNGYFVGFFGVNGTELVFEITADAAVTDATLVLRLASEWGTLTVDTSVLKIEVNGTELDYTPFTVTGKKIAGAEAVEYGVPFNDFTISPKIALQAGANTIKLIAQGKHYGDSQSMDIGPGVDCIKIKSSATLTWESLWEDNKLNVKEK